MNSPIYLSKPVVFDEVHREMNVFWKEGYFSTVGPQINRLESDLAGLNPTPKSYVTALNSATSAIHLALKNCNVGKGDVVLCQSLTFAACVNAILYLDAEPVLVDSERDTWNMDPDLLREAVVSCIKRGRKPKAILAVHIYGMPFKVSEILKISEEYNIPIIEDAAEALGSKYSNTYCGYLGEQSVFSFNGNKIISAAGGGVLVSKKLIDADRARFWSKQSKEDGQGYLHKEIGYNYSMSNLQAVLALGMLPHLDKLVKDRRRIFRDYKTELSNMISWQPEITNSYSNRWLSAGLLESELVRDKVINSLKSNQIETRPIWRPMHKQPFCENFTVFENGVSEDLWRRGICLPSGYGTDVSVVINRIKSI